MMRMYVYAAIAAVILALLAALAVQSARLHRAQLVIAGMERDAAAAAQNAERTAREAEQRITAASDRAAQEYERGKTDAETTANRITADLRAGTLKLRREWAGCETSRLSEGAAATRELDAAAAVRARLAGEIVRLGAQADAQVRGLQAVVIADRSAR